ncbi:hypothetical protein [Sporosarcina sp. Te-1]|uniref:hypothetical protein n=1 Tax=Sporosarcina sp. Te-1 TaxID=2818390 RepID=UPI001A9D8188|nr:hypothetical protein [Sporosarcina sp. Te-1]QTD43199.1 hypothetical protein J3U78_10865 [Sporosarcina sp. Te-1]
MNRIYFANNPWPNGHRITNFEWGAHFKYDEEDESEGRAGLYFDFHLETADYYEEDKDEEEDNEDDEDIDDWQAKIVWSNYHSCTLSSEEWDIKGFRVGSDESLFDLKNLDGTEYKIDHLTEEEQKELDLERAAFDVYLLGQDATAFHTITFTKVEGQTYDIDWKGKVALAYVGDHGFRYDFHTAIPSASFRGITIPDELTDQEAYDLLARFVKELGLFKIQTNNEQRRFVFR